MQTWDAFHVVGVVAILDARFEFEDRGRPFCFHPRAAFDRLETIAKMETVLKKVTQLDLTSQDIEAAFALINNDIEDNVHYILSQKRKCEAIITNNIKDFSVFNIKLINPKNRMLKSYVS